MINQQNLISAAAKKTVCERFGIRWDDLLCESRAPEIVEARRAFFWILVKVFGCSMKSAGKDMGRKHPTVIHAIRKAGEYVPGTTPYNHLQELIQTTQQYVKNQNKKP